MVRTNTWDFTHIIYSNVRTSQLWLRKSLHGSYTRDNKKCEVIIARTWHLADCDSVNHYRVITLQLPTLRTCWLQYREYCVASFGPPCLFNDYLSTGEATCYVPEEGSKKSSRKPVYGMWYFWNRDVVEIGVEVVWVMFRLDYWQLSSGK